MNRILSSVGQINDTESAKYLKKSQTHSISTPKTPCSSESVKLKIAFKSV